MTSATPTVVRNRIDNLFERCRAEKRAALVLYITSGFPDEDTTRAVLPAVAEAGCDLLELGVPFSDPIADGPIIQRSSAIALDAGMTFPKTLDILREFRQKSDIPTILFGALNPFLVRGLDESARLAAEAGADGFLAADLPYEESDEFREACRRQNLHLVTLVAPTTPADRVAQIASKSSGFLYCIAMKGTTGQGSGLRADARPYMERVRSRTDLPLALGFGISLPEHVRSAVDSGADGVVVGSALITVVEEARRAGRSVERAAHDYVAALVRELHRR